MFNIYIIYMLYILYIYIYIYIYNIYIYIYTHTHIITCLLCSRNREITSERTGFPH